MSRWAIVTEPTEDDDATYRLVEMCGDGTACVVAKFYTLKMANHFKTAGECLDLLDEGVVPAPRPRRNRAAKKPTPAKKVARQRK